MSDTTTPERDDAGSGDERFVVVTRDRTGHHRGSRPMTREAADTMAAAVRADNPALVDVSVQPYVVDSPAGEEERDDADDE